MNQPPLNPDALEEASNAVRRIALGEVNSWDVAETAIKAYLAAAQPEAQKLTDAEWQAFQAIPDQGYSHRSWVDARIAERVAVAQPVVTGEQVNLAGWTCNGIHEPGDYSTCEECRDACDDLARFYNHMMRNPRPFKHWTGNPEVKP